MSPADSKYKKKSDVRFRVVADEAVVVRQAEAEVLVLNEVGARILQLVDEGLAHQQLVDRLAEEFEAPEGEVAQDAEVFLARLVEVGVLEPV
jgi:hypothetical protein